MQKQKTIKIDVDGCIRDIFAVICDVYEKETGIQKTLEDIFSYDVDDSTAAALYNQYCIPIKKSELRPLDLVFNAALTHMAVVGRDGKIYEAAGSDIGVVVNNSVDDRIVQSIYGKKYGTAEKYRKDPWTKFGRLKIYENILD